MKLIENWRDCWKWVSMQAAFAQIAGGVVYAGLPAQFHTAAWANAALLVNGALSFCILFGRLVQQTPPTNQGAP